MPLEATVICLDNSEYMRNGDHVPTRLEAQHDAVNLICAAKTQQNPESAVAVMTMSQSKTGIKAEVLVTLTQDLGKILNSMATVKVGGDVEFSSALQVAQLVLKHRMNKNQHQRIITFVGSPIKETVEDLVKLGKKLKKNNIAVDVVNFGEEAQNAEKLESFINAVKTNDDSHLITVPVGPHILSDMLLSSPIVVGEGGGGGFGAAAAASAAAAAARGGDFDFGVDPSLDPELAMAIRLSMEEERARQAQATKTDGDQPAGTTQASGDVDMGEQDEDLLAAMAMSMNQGAAPSTPTPETKQPHQPPAAAQQPQSTATPMEADDDDDEEMRLALQMSMQQSAPSPSSSTPASSSAAASTSAPATSSSSTPAPAPNTAALGNQDFLNSVLSSLPGVNPNDERIKSVLQSMKKDEKKDEKKDDKK